MLYLVYPADPRTTALFWLDLAHRDPRPLVWLDLAW